MALLAASPAIGHANPAICRAKPAGGVDQRGSVRHAAGCDSGAYDTAPVG